MGIIGFVLIIVGVGSGNIGLVLLGAIFLVLD